MKKYCVLIGRFQPYHNEHHRLVKRMLGDQSYDGILILIGSFGSPRSNRNPWSAFERETMIKECLSMDETKKTIFIPIRDYPDEDGAWKKDVKSVVAKRVDPGSEIHLLSAVKDVTSSYQNLFPDWHMVHDEVISELNATDIRHAFFADSPIWRNFVPNGVKLYLDEYRESDSFEKLKNTFSKT